VGGDRRRGLRGQPPPACGRGPGGHTVAVTGFGLPARRVGEALGVTGIAILRSLARGQDHWRRHNLEAKTLAQAILCRGTFGIW
jgi:hypothetical protein